MRLPAECINAVVGWWSERWIPNDTREAFRAALQALLESWEEPDVPADFGGRLLVLSCDYDPEGLLLEAVRAAGVDCRGFMFSADGILPRKHCVVIRRNLAEAKSGYGATFVVLWRAP